MSHGRLAKGAGVPTGEPSNFRAVQGAAALTASGWSQSR
jgi:hypothetical protein